MGHKIEVFDCLGYFRVFFGQLFRCKVVFLYFYCLRNILLDKFAGTRGAILWCGLLDELVEESHKLMVSELRVMREELLAADLLEGGVEEVL